MPTDWGISNGKDAIDTIKVEDRVAMEKLLAQFEQKHKELGKRQREYKKTLSMRHKTRNDTIIEKSYQSASERLHLERNDLRAQIWVANGATHLRENNNFLEKIKCHVECQEELAKIIRTLKKNISHMERGIQNISKEIYYLNRKTVPDTQHQAHVASERKKLSILENHLEVGIRQESMFSASNALLRERIDNILYDRKRFYDSYTKLMQNLNSDKKYLSDLMECAFNAFENCIDVHEKIDLLTKKKSKEKDARKFEAQSIMRKKEAAQEAEEFLNSKAKMRSLADLQPKEYRRRENFKRNHNRKINLYNDILTKLLRYCKAHDVSEVTDRFQQQESLYYSYFSYVNEISYHVTLLNDSVNRLYVGVENMRLNQKRDFSDQISTIAQLEVDLDEKKQRNSELSTEREIKEKRMLKLFSDMNSIIRSCKLNAFPLSELLGDFSELKLENIRHFTKILESRVINIVANVYCQERADPTKPYERYVIKDIEKIMEFQTDIRDIVLTQQCPECAEGEAYNMEEMADSGVRVLSVDEAKRKLYEKVNQPEMQYRLHNISHCRLPRSRLLAAKRNV